MRIGNLLELAVAWMDDNLPAHSELLRFRAEAQQLLGTPGDDIRP